MVKQTPLESRWQAVLNGTSRPPLPGLPSTVVTERRNLAARRALLCRIHNEFEEMPGLSLTLPQAARLFNFPPDTASRILDRLTASRVLRKRPDGRFVRTTTEDRFIPAPAQG